MVIIKTFCSVAASATRLCATGVDFILLDVGIGWSLSTNLRPAGNKFLLGMGHAARKSNVDIVVCWWATTLSIDKTRPSF